MNSDLLRQLSCRYNFSTVLSVSGYTHNANFCLFSSTLSPFCRSVGLQDCSADKRAANPRFSRSATPKLETGRIYNPEPFWCRNGRKTPVQSALRAAVNRGKGALHPRPFILQPNRRQKPADLGLFPPWQIPPQNRPNSARSLLGRYTLHRAAKVGTRGDRLAHRAGFSFFIDLPSSRSKQLSV